MEIEGDKRTADRGAPTAKRQSYGLNPPPATASAGGAGRAEPEDVDHVARLGVAVSCRRRGSPLLDVVRLDLLSPAAVPADEVVMMAGRGAGAVQRLAVVGLQGVRVPLDREVGERAIDRRETDGGAGSAQIRVQLLRTDEARPVAESGPHRLPLPGVALHRDQCRRAVRAPLRAPMTRQ